DAGGSDVFVAVSVAVIVIVFAPFDSAIDAMFQVPDVVPDPPVMLAVPLPPAEFDHDRLVTVTLSDQVPSRMTVAAAVAKFAPPPVVTATSRLVRPRVTDTGSVPRL